MNRITRKIEVGRYYGRIVAALFAECTLAHLTSLYAGKQKRGEQFNSYQRLFAHLLHLRIKKALNKFPHPTFVLSCFKHAFSHLDINKQRILLDRFFKVNRIFGAGTLVPIHVASVT